MKIKIGDTVYEAGGVPIMIILTDQDKQNIKDMHPDCTRYAIFSDNFGTKKEMLDWMEN